MLLQLASEVGVVPKRIAATHGGEYHSACPGCGGKDRFFIQPYWKGKGRYRCRQCGKSGDAIQFCRDFLGMDYRSACEKVGVDCRTQFNTKTWNVSPGFIPKASKVPVQEWVVQASDFVASAHQNLMKNLRIVQQFHNTRGLSSDSLSQFSLGWNPSDQWGSRITWGLSPEVREDGREKRLWLPRGTVIPTIRDGAVEKLKIRRADWKEGDRVGKYIIVPGSASTGSIFGDDSLPVTVLVEAELDAMLVVQEAGSLCSCITMGGLGHPDERTHQWLRTRRLILFALDWDEPGKKAYEFWSGAYRPCLQAWPVPIQKSPCDAYLAGTNLRQWLLGGMLHYGLGR